MTSTPSRTMSAICSARMPSVPFAGSMRRRGDFASTMKPRTPSSVSAVTNSRSQRAASGTSALAPSIRQPLPARPARVARPCPQNQPASRVTTAAKTGASDWKAGKMPLALGFRSLRRDGSGEAQRPRERDSQRRVAVSDFIERDRVQHRGLIHRFDGRRGLGQSQFPGAAKKRFRKFARPRRRRARQDEPRRRRTARAAAWTRVCSSVSAKEIMASRSRQYVSELISSPQAIVAAGYSCAEGGWRDDESGCP